MFFLRVCGGVQQVYCYLGGVGLLFLFDGEFEGDFEKSLQRVGVVFADRR